MSDGSTSARRSKPTAVGLLGLGAIGSSVVELLQERPGLRIVGALVRRPGERGDVRNVPIVHALDDLLERGPDIIAEVAGHGALKAHGPAILRSRRDLVVVSVGALADQGIFAELGAAASGGGTTVTIVAGAIGGLDAIAAAAVGGLDKVTYLVRRPPDQLLPHVMSDNPSAETEVFSGSAREAALRFPENLNAAAAVGLSGLGLDQTEVRIVVDPAVDRIHHEIAATGRFGQLSVSVANPESPSRLVAMSVVRALESRSWAPLRVV